MTQRTQIEMICVLCVICGQNSNSIRAAMLRGGT